MCFVCSCCVFVLWGLMVMVGVLYCVGCVLVLIVVVVVCVYYASDCGVMCVLFCLCWLMFGGCELLVSVCGWLCVVLLYGVVVLMFEHGWFI